MMSEIESRKLSELLESLESGGRPKGGVANIRTGIPSIGGEHITRRGGFDLSEIRYVPEDYFRSMRRGKVRRHDILLVKDGATTGKVAFVDETFPYKEAAVNEHVFIVRPSKQKVVARYLFFFLYSTVGQSQILSNFHGAAQGGINSSFADNVIVPTPPTKVQEKISAVLEKTYRLKEKREEANQLTNKIIQSIFLKVFGDPLYALDQMPTSELEEVCVQVTDGTHDTPKYVTPETGVPFIMARNVREGKLDFSDIRYVSRKDHEEIIKRSYPRKGDVLYVNIGANRAIAAEVDVDFEFSIKNVALFKPDPTRILSKYLVWLLNYPTFKLHVLSQSRGGAQNFLHLDFLRKLRVPIPRLELQEKFQVSVEIVEKMIQRQQTSTAEIEELFHSLMHKAFRGELVA